MDRVTPRVPRTPRVFVLGGMNVDFILQTPGFPEAGASLIGDSFCQSFGGKGANQAVAAARMGAQVAMAGMTGDDEFGRQIGDMLRREKIDTTHVLRSEEVGTGTAWIMIEPSGQNRIIAIPGANLRYSLSELEKLRQAIAASEVLLLQLELPYDVTVTAVAMAAELGVPVFFNPGPIGGAGFPNRLLPNITVLTPNETEAEQLTGIPITGWSAAERAAAMLLQQGVLRVVLTLGGQGALVAEAGAPLLRVPAYEVQAVDTVAAGDTFTGALAVRLCEGATLQEAADYACAAAAIAVTRHGAMPSIPTREETERFIRSAPRRRDPNGE
jgi:ribokinase